ncbi:MAG: Ltp family lipoprotein [Rhodoglobus sp.]
MTTADPTGALPEPSAQTPHAQQPPTPIDPSPTATLPPPPHLPKKPIGLALAALLIGIAAFLSGLVPVFGALVGITAIVFGILALRKQQSKGMAVAGIVLGGIAVLASIGTTAGISAAVNNASVNEPRIVVTQSAEPVVDEPTVSPSPEATQAAEAEAPAVPAEYRSALSKATSYSDNLYMSKAGIYNQLTSEYGEKFSPEAAQYGIDNMVADWNANALAKAKTYQESMSMSPEAIRDQLTSEYGEKFTAEEADYAIQHLND